MAEHDGDKLLRLAEVEALTGRKRSTIYRLMQLGDFPESVQLSPRAVRWWQREIERWLANRPRTQRDR